MVLGVDAQRATGRRTGVGRQLEYLLRAWARNGPPFEEVRVFSPSPLEGMPRHDRFHYEVVGNGGPVIWWQTRHLRRRATGVDVLFCTYDLPFGFTGRSVISNFGIYEGAFALPGWRARLRSRHHAYSARQADAVIANSVSTKNDLVRHYSIAPDRITVIHPGAYERFRPPRDDERDVIATTVEGLLGERAPYFLFVGKFSQRRNVPALLEAFAQVVSGHPDYHLLLVGPNTSNVPLRELVASLGIERNVHHVEHLDHEELALVYRGAHAFVLPSEHEGFSGTIPEAISSWCPVVTVAHAALADGGVEEGVLALPDAAPGTLAEAMRRVAGDCNFHQELRDRARRCAESFPSMEAHASSVAEVIHGVAAR